MIGSASLAIVVDQPVKSFEYRVCSYSQAEEYRESSWCVAAAGYTSTGDSFIPTFVDKCPDTPCLDITTATLIFIKLQSAHLVDLVHSTTRRALQSC